MTDKLNKAEDLLQEAYDTLVERGKLHDKAGAEERSLGAVAEMMTALKGQPYTAQDIGLVQICVKLVRSQQGNYHHDNFVDLAGYAALTGEEAHKQHLDGESKKTRQVTNGDAPHLRSLRCSVKPLTSSDTRHALVDYGTKDKSETLLHIEGEWERLPTYLYVSLTIGEVEQNTVASIRTSSLKDVTLSDLSEVIAKTYTAVPTTLQFIKITHAMLSSTQREYTVLIPTEHLADKRHRDWYKAIVLLLAKYLDDYVIP